jgi:hypothetical protein
MRPSWWTLVLLLLLALATPASAAMSSRLDEAPRCTTYEEKTMQRWQTVCSDGSRATSYWNRTLERWETTVQPGPGVRRSCTTQKHPQTKDVHVHCR